MRAHSMAGNKWQSIARARRTPRIRSQKAWRSTLLLGGLMAASIAINVAIVAATRS